MTFNMFDYIMAFITKLKVRRTKYNDYGRKLGYEEWEVLPK